MGVTEWRIDGTHGLHVVDEGRPVATFHDQEDARTAVACVQRVNGTGSDHRPSVSGVRRPDLDPSDWPLVIREVMEDGHPYYGTDVDEALRDYALAVQNRISALEVRAKMSKRIAEDPVEDSRRVQAVRLVLGEVSRRKMVEVQAVEAALVNPGWRIEHAKTNQ